MVRLDRTFSTYISSGVQGVLCTSWMGFKHIERQQTFSNYILTEIARYRDFFHMSSGWFDWTEPSPTTSLQGIQGVQGAICTSSGRFKRIEPHRTFSNDIHTERARYIDFFYMSSGWFDWTEPSPTTSLHGIEGVQGALVREVQATRTSSNLLEVHSQRASKVNRLLSHELGVIRLDGTFSNYISSGVQGAICTSWMRFKHIETSSNYLLTDIARYIDFFHTSSGWFDWTEPSPTTYHQGIQGVQGAICTSSRGSCTSNLIEPSRTTFSQS